MNQSSLMDITVIVVAGLICIGGAVGVVGFRNPVHNALSLVATLFGVAVMFVSQQSYFLAAIQVIVYAGAVVVVFLFVIMLLGVDKVERLEGASVPYQRIGAAVACAALGVLVLVALLAGSPQITGQPGAGLTGTDINELAKEIFTNNVWAFEITSVLLGIAVVAAVLLATKSAEAPIDGDDYPSGESIFEADRHHEAAARIEWEIDTSGTRASSTSANGSTGNVTAPAATGGES